MIPGRCWSLWALSSRPEQRGYQFKNMERATVMEMKDGKFIFTAEELKKLIDKISYCSYKEGILDAGRQMKYAVELENDETFQWDADSGDDGRFFEEDAG